VRLGGSIGASSRVNRLDGGWNAVGDGPAGQVRAHTSRCEVPVRLSRSRQRSPKRMQALVSARIATAAVKTSIRRHALVRCYTLCEQGKADIDHRPDTLVVDSLREGPRLRVATAFDGARSTECTSPTRCRIKASDTRSDPSGGAFHEQDENPSGRRGDEQGGGHFRGERRSP